MSVNLGVRSTDEVSVLVVRAVVDGAVAVGMSRPALLAAADLDEEVLNDVDGTLPQHREEDVWRAILHASGGEVPLLGFRAASRLSRGSFGELEYLARTSSSVAKALEATASHARILHHSDIFQWSEGAMVYDSPHDIQDRVGWVAAEFALGAVLHTLRDAASADIGRASIELRHSAWGDVAGCEQLLGATLRFSSERYALVVDDAALAVGMSLHDPVLHDILARFARRRSDALPRRGDIAGRVRRVIERRLGHTSTALDEIATELGLSGRGLQSRLKDAGAPSLRELLNEARIHAAKRRLRDTDESIASVAHHLGYSGTRAFHRAFKQWTGITPAFYRNRSREVVRAEPVRSSV